MFPLAVILTFLAFRHVHCTEGPAPNDPLVANDAAHLLPRQQFSNGKQAMDRLVAQYTSNTRAALSSNGGACTAENIVVRKEWGNLSPQEKSSFISAVQCLNNAPGRSPPGLSPDARNRWDDFTIVHNINTPSIHWSGLMLPWHRHYLYELELALRSECGYQGYLPYWDYAKYLDRPAQQNPLFDGSQTSLGGDGNPLTSCVEDGPFANFAVNMPPPDPATATQQRNPRCIKRKFVPGMMEQYASYDRISQIIESSPDIVTFHFGLEGPQGLHPNPHTYIGGLQNNIYLASQDPWFFLHHCMIDRVWAIWESLDFNSRTGALDAFTWFEDRDRLDFGPLPAATLDTTIYLSPIFENGTVRDVMSPTGGQLCYIYD